MKSATENISSLKENSELKRIVRKQKDTLASSDSQLWQDFKSGSEIAFSKIYQQNANALYGYGLKLVNSEELVKDAIHDIFIEIWNSKKNAAKVNHIKPYLFKAMRRKVISLAVKSRKTTNLNAATNFLEEVAPSTELKLIEKQVFDKRKEELNIALNKLTKKQKEIIHLKFFAQLSYTEISEVMGITKKGTYKLFARAIEFLRDYMHIIILFIDATIIRFLQ